MKERKEEEGHSKGAGDSELLQDLEVDSVEAGEIEAAHTACGVRSPSRDTIGAV